ncbi:hypothetical protein, partial [Burkholderia vietnamiensis]|uniref:hypothetical protein n=1 Tax=Burkholderia vietnamiensis TaxID=60552 RepID=UPI001ABB3E6C
DHAHRAVPHRRQARLLSTQSACLVSRITHCILKRACFYFSVRALALAAARLRKSADGREPVGRGSSGIQGLNCIVETGQKGTPSWIYDRLRSCQSINSVSIVGRCCDGFS